MVKKLILFVCISKTFFFCSIFGLAENTKQSIQPTKIKAPMVLRHEVGKTVILQFKIDENGKPLKIDAIKYGCYDELLSKRVIKAAYEWEFPAILDDNGQPQVATLRLPVVIKSIENY